MFLHDRREFAEVVPEWKRNIRLIRCALSDTMKG
jgi:hypothetical protein